MLYSETALDQDSQEGMHTESQLAFLKGNSDSQKSR